MSTDQSANIFIKNLTDGDAFIQLFHIDQDKGQQGGCWEAGPGEQVGPLPVRFDTGWDSSDYDLWCVILDVKNGTHPGRYISTGSSVWQYWKECLLMSSDAGTSPVFGVNQGTFFVALHSGGCTNPMMRIGDFSQISNVFVLMLENHSFDNILGQSGIPGIQHATPDDTNAFDGKNYAVSSPAPVSMPTDPGHEFQDVVQQLTGIAVQGKVPEYPKINNSGYVTNYATTTTEGPVPGPQEYGDIMAGFDTPNQLPVTYQLATEFAVCDQWFSSLPGPTWPNRFFVHGASSSGLDHSPSSAEMVAWESVDGFSYAHGSIFDAMNRANIPFRLYNDQNDVFSDHRDPTTIGGIPIVSSLKNITMGDVADIQDFARDIHNPYPYAYTFIEPNYGDVSDNNYMGGSSQHPMDDVVGGERLMKAVYETIRNSPLWDRSLLVIVYDEHGGFYDSAVPPKTVPPGDGNDHSDYNQFGFNFDQLGPRVPAIVVSPLIAKGTVDHTVYDHASVPATLERLFGMPSLTHRDGQANDLQHLLTLSEPRQDCPNILSEPAEHMKVSKPARTLEEVEAVNQQPFPDKGNAPNFLGIMLKTAREMASTDEEKADMLTQFKAIKTVGDARTYMQKVYSMVEARRQNKMPFST